MIALYKGLCDAMSKTVAESMSSSFRPQWRTRGPDEVNDKTFTDFCECESDFMPVLIKIILLIKTSLLHKLFLSFKGYVYNMDHRMVLRTKSPNHTPFKRFLFHSSLVLWVECLADCTSAAHLPIWFHLKGAQSMSSGTATQHIQ